MHARYVCVRERAYYMCVLKTQKVKSWQCGSSVHSGRAGELRYRCPAVHTHSHLKLRLGVHQSITRTKCPSVYVLLEMNNVLCVYIVLYTVCDTGKTYGE